MCIRDRISKNIKIFFTAEYAEDAEKFRDKETVSAFLCALCDLCGKLVYLFVYRLVRQGIRLLVLFPWYVSYLDLADPVNKFLSLRM